MTRKITCIIIMSLMLLANSSIFGQNVAVTDDDSYVVEPTAMLDVKSTSKGLLIPRLTSGQRTSIIDPAAGLLVYDSDLNVFYYFDGTDWINISKSQIWEVNSNFVYLTSLNNNVGIGTTTPNSKLEVRADDSFTADDTLFSVKDKNGNTVFAVFPDGVKVIVDELSKGKVGGFAVSGRSPSKGGAETEILIVTPDSTCIFVNDSSSVKGKVGGFAVSGRSPSKGITNDYFQVTSDSTRVYVTESITKGKVGGFAVSGRSPSKGVTNDYLVVTIDSTRIYVNDSLAVKGKVGGFAVSGRSPSKGASNDYLQVTRDSTRVYITDDGTKGKVGGFAVSGRNPSKAGVEKDYFNISANLTAENIDNEPRIIWYPEKSAFMAGEVHVGSADSVGTNSTALGYRSISKGNWSQAFGYKSIAYGTYATAIGSEAEADTNSLAVGYQARAIGNDAYALGSGASAIADKSFAFGSVGIDSLGNITGNTQATGEYAYAIGLGAVASGKGAFAIGANDTASGIFATAVGYKTKSSGYYSTAMGGYAEAQNHYTVAIGYRNKAQGIGSVSLGFQNNAEGLYSFASGFRSKGTGFQSIALGAYCQTEGSYSIAIGDQASTGLSGSWALSLGRNCESNSVGSVAIGYQSVADGAYTVAMGYQDTATSAAAYSVAIGYRNKATSVYSLAMGSNTTASMLYASAFGNTTIASGQNSFAAGYLSQASGNAATTFGTSNTASGYNSMALGYDTEAQTYGSLVIGRYNLITGASTYWQGTEPLFVAGNGTSSGTPSNALTLYQDGDMEISGDFYPITDNTKDLGRTGNRWDDVYATNGTIQTSDKRLKTDINDIKYGLKEILELRPVSFKWIDNSGKGLRLGLIAQETQLVIGEVVDVGDDKDNTLGLRYSELIPVLIKSIQEQQLIIEEQKKKNEKLELQLKQIMERLEKLEKE